MTNTWADCGTSSWIERDSVPRPRRARGSLIPPAPPSAFVNPLCSLPEIFRLWAGEPHDLVCRNTKHLAGQIRGGNWATRGMLVEQCHCWHWPGHRLVLAEALNHNLWPCPVLEGCTTTLRSTATTHLGRCFRTDALSFVNRSIDRTTGSEFLTYLRVRMSAHP